MITLNNKFQDLKNKTLIHTTLSHFYSFRHPLENQNQNKAQTGH